MIPPPPTSTLFPYTTLFRSSVLTFLSLGRAPLSNSHTVTPQLTGEPAIIDQLTLCVLEPTHNCEEVRSEEHTSELQSRFDLVCRLLLEKKKNYQRSILTITQ